MNFLTKKAKHDLVLAVLGVGLIGVMTASGATIVFQSAAAQNAGDADTSDTPAPHGLRKRVQKPVTPKKAEPPTAAPVPAPPAPAAAAPAPGDVAGRLRAAGAGTCAAEINAAAASVMGNVVSSNTVSNWPKTAVDKRIASVSIGQAYPAGSAVPFAATTVVAAPNPTGACDAISVQVVPSPLPCDKLRDNMLARNKLIGDLAGVPLMQDAGGAQTMLVPTAGNACVLVGIRTAFAK